jgi:RNA binding exosome subunit
MKEKNNLIKINPEKIVNSSSEKRVKDILLTLALVRNDISDLIYLQGLHVKNSPPDLQKVDEKSGQFTGRRIYIIRLVLSHFHEFLVFLDKRSKEIEDNDKLKKILDRLSDDEKALWIVFGWMAKKEYKKLKPWVLNVLNLAETARHDVTFHYYGSSKYLNDGFSEAFFKKPMTKKNEFAYATEIRSVKEDRSFYIDLALQVYLEKELKIKDLFLAEKDVIDLLSSLNRLLTDILSLYHNDLSD